MPATYENLATTTLGSTTSTITFSSISSAYTDLVISIFCQNAAVSAGTRTGVLTVNGDTGSNYSTTQLRGDGSSATSTQSTGSTSIFYAEIPRIGSGTNLFGHSRISFFNYAGSTNKTLLCENSADLNGSGFVVRNVGLWRNTAAITSITLAAGGEGFTAGTTATLYGILRA
jgi:hypothetical protein